VLQADEEPEEVSACLFVLPGTCTQAINYVDTNISSISYDTIQIIIST